MTDQTPVERAAQSLPAALATTEQLEHLARAVFASIDTDELAAVLSANWRNMHTNESLGRQRMLARAVKNWLTGKGNQ